MQINKPQQFFVYNCELPPFSLDGLDIGIKNNIQKISKISRTGLSLYDWIPNNPDSDFFTLEPSEIYLVYSKNIGYDLPGTVDPTNYCDDPNYLKGTNESISQDQKSEIDLFLSSYSTFNLTNLPQFNDRLKINNNTNKIYKIKLGNNEWDVLLNPNTMLSKDTFYGITLDGKKVFLTITNDYLSVKIEDKQNSVFIESLSNLATSTIGDKRVVMYNSSSIKQTNFSCSGAELLTSLENEVASLGTSGYCSFAVDINFYFDESFAKFIASSLSLGPKINTYNIFDPTPNTYPPLPSFSFNVTNDSRVLNKIYFIFLSILNAVSEKFIGKFPYDLIFKFKNISYFIPLNSPDANEVVFNFEARRPVKGINVLYVFLPLYMGGNSITGVGGYRIDGIAPYGTPPGGNRAKHALCNAGYNRLNTLDAADKVLSHEIGHTLAIYHDLPRVPCDYIMCSCATCAAKNEWSCTSINSFTKTMKSYSLNFASPLGDLCDKVCCGGECCENECCGSTCCNSDECCEQKENCKELTCEQCSTTQPPDGGGGGDGGGNGGDNPLPNPQPPLTNKPVFPPLPPPSTNNPPPSTNTPPPSTNTPPPPTNTPPDTDGSGSNGVIGLENIYITWA